MKISKHATITASVKFVVLFAAMGAGAGLSGCGSVSTPAAATTDQSAAVSTVATKQSIALVLNASAATIAPNSTATVYAAGGTPPYAYSMTSGAGTLGSSTGIFTAPSTSESAAFKVTDSAGSVASVSISVAAQIAITPANSTISVGQSLSFTATGGAAPYTYQMLSGSGTMSGSTYSSSWATTGTVVVTDSSGLTAMAVVTVQAAGSLVVSPTTATIDIDSSQTLTVSGGTAPYTYRILSGNGTMIGNTFDSPDSATVTRILVRDSLGVQVSAMITVQSLALVSACQAYTMLDASGVTHYGKMALVAGSSVCDIPLRVDTSNPNPTCPSGWTSLQNGSGTSYTITAAQTYSSDSDGTGGKTNVTTAQHTAFGAVATESVSVCTSHNLFYCTQTATRFAGVTDIACY